MREVEITDENGVDLTLIDEMLAMTVEERLAWHDELIQGIEELRNEVKEQTD